MTNELFLKIIETTFPESKISDYAQKLVTLTEAAKKLAEWAIEDPKAPVKDIFVAIEDLERKSVLTRMPAIDYGDAT